MEVGHQLLHETRLCSFEWHDSLMGDHSFFTHVRYMTTTLVHVQVGPMG